MKRFIFILIMLMVAVVNAAWYGEHDIDEYLTFAVTTSRFSSGAGYDAASVPTYSIYEDETAAEVVGPSSMAKLDDGGTVGFYTERVQLTDANFDAGKMYTIYITATVDAVAAITSHAFKMRAAPIATAAEMAKVPKSDSTVSWNATALTAIELQANNALVDENLDQLLKIAVGTNYQTTVHADSVIGYMTTSSATADYVRTTDSLEDLRDQGDAAWKTGIAASTSNAIDTNGGTIVVDWGDELSGDDDDTALDDGTRWVISSDDQQLDVRLVFTLGTAKTASSIHVNGYTDAGPGEYTNVFAYNYLTTTFDQLSDSGSRMNDASSDVDYGPFVLLPAHQQASDGEVIVRFYSTVLEITDELRLDQVLVSAVGTGGLTLDDIGDAVASHDVSNHTDHDSLGFNVHMAGIIEEYDVTTGNTASTFTCSSLPATTNWYQYHRVRIHETGNNIYADSWILSMNNAGVVILGKTLPFTPDTSDELYIRDSIISPAEVWAATTRILTALDEDDTTIDLDASATDLSAITGDKNSYKATGFATPTNITAGTITTVTNVTTVNGLAANVITAGSINAAAIDAATFAADVDAEIAAYILNAATNAYGGAGTYGQAIEDTLADTNELQIDWVDGGRLDLIIDIIQAYWDSLTITGGFLEIDIKAVDGTTVKSTNGNVHALPGNI